MGRAIKPSVSLGTLFIFAFSVSVTAQQSMHLGLSSGLVISELTNLDFLHPGPAKRTGRKALQVAAIAELDLNSVWSIQLAPRYMRNGADFSYEGSTGACPICSDDGGVTEEFNYLEVPVFVKLRLSAQEFTPFVYAGTSVAFLLSVKEARYSY